MGKSGSAAGSGRGLAVGLEALEIAEGFLVGALGVADTAVQTHEDVAGGGKSLAQGNTFGAAGAHGVVLPELRLDAEEAAEQPFVADEGIDEETLVGGAGEEASEVLVLEFGELLAALADDEGGVGIETGFEGVLGGRGFAFGSAGSGGLEGVEAVGVNLALSGHSGWRGGGPPSPRR